MGSLDRRALLEDSFFLDQLARVLHAPLPPEAKVDAFVLLLDKIGWLFAGSVPVPPDRSYVWMFTGIVGTLFQYQEHLAREAWDVAPFLGIAESQCQVHVVRCSNALLLAAILDRGAAEAAVERAIAPEKLRQAEVEAVFLHGLTLSAALTRSPQRILRLGDLLGETGLEEGREDIVAALSLLASPEAMEVLRSFVGRDLRRRFDNATTSALRVASQHTPPSELDAWLADLARELPPEARERLERARARGFADRLETEGRLWHKLWDGFDVTVYEDGMRLETARGFGYFRQNQ